MTGNAAASSAGHTHPYNPPDDYRDTTRAKAAARIARKTDADAARGAAVHMS
eukprot:CAMPEP_0180232400 /NCGR_PEP_ID=MMETSP0987-20121128/27450_1 /TAXON_ID=697907 /ORGANISM="non described non described, Strain CCMP2293" /LENGTH=51 /DNA_ID=CAMNT_0022198005 /DNA_START=589 /DNA_END=743 /DNA_ORIENTATION=+